MTLRDDGEVEDVVGEPGERAPRPGPPVGSPAWLELERAKVRGTDRIGKEASGRALLAIGVGVLVVFGAFDLWLMRPRGDALFELTPYGVLLLCVFPILLGGALVVVGWRSRRA